MLSLALTSLCETSAWARLRALLIAPILIALFALAACGGGGGGQPRSPTRVAMHELRHPAGRPDRRGRRFPLLLRGCRFALADQSGWHGRPGPAHAPARGFRRARGPDGAGHGRDDPERHLCSASIRLDYANAEVSVEVNGAPVAATVVNARGQPLGVVDLDLMLDNRNHVVIAPGRPALLQLDFDLAASHEVDITTVPAIAVAQPFVVATIEPVEDKELRVRGPLVSVDTNASSYVSTCGPSIIRARGSAGSRF